MRARGRVRGCCVESLYSLPPQLPEFHGLLACASARANYCMMGGWEQVCVHSCICSGEEVSSPPSPCIPVFLPLVHPDTPAASSTLAIHMGLPEPTSSLAPARGNSPLLPTPHPAAVPAGRWGWLLACGCWSSLPSTSTSPQPASSTSGEGSGAVGCCCHSPGYAQPRWVRD